MTVDPVSVGTSRQPKSNIVLRDMGSFYVGGRKVLVEDLPPQEVLFSPKGAPAQVDPNGEYWVEQMYAQYFMLAEPTAKVPMLLWHGGGSTGTTYETTPDGRDGWVNIFLRLGWSVYCSDAVERGRSGWPALPVRVWDGDAIRASDRDVARRARFGGDGSVGSFGESSQFPKEHFDAFLKGSVPRWLTTDEPTYRAYLELVTQVGPSVVVVTSQGGQFGCRVATAASDKVKALVLVEPAQVGDLRDAHKLVGVPVLILFGDFIDTDPRWQANRDRAQAYVNAINAAGGTAELLNLPDLGIEGNSHCLMAEQNNDVVAKLIHVWLGKRSLLALP